MTQIIGQVYSSKTNNGEGKYIYFHSNCLHLHSVLNTSLYSSEMEGQAVFILPPQSSMLLCISCKQISTKVLFVTHQPCLILYVSYKTLPLFSACEAPRNVSLILQKSLYVRLSACFPVYTWFRVHVFEPHICPKYWSSN